MIHGIHGNFGFFAYEIVDAGFLLLPLMKISLVQAPYWSLVTPPYALALLSWCG
jgi:hypothetical protein